MRVMAYCACSNRNRTMYILFLYHAFIMACETEFWRIAVKLELVWRLMRVMTTRTFAVFNRRMNTLHGVFFIMTFIADPGYIFYRPEFVLGTWFMTRLAFTCSYRSMDKLSFAHFGMASGCDAGCFRLCICNSTKRKLYCSGSGNKAK